jgi:hypothetical protein
MLLRRGSDYLIYAESSAQIIEQLTRDCQDALTEAHSQWGIKATLHNASFKKDESVDEALEEIYSHQTPEGAE